MPVCVRMSGTGETGWETGVALYVKPLLVRILAHVVPRTCVKNVTVQGR